MKIEKLNDQQIRCTLTREDLASRHIRLAELAYGSEKTRALFRDMMDQASQDFGFDVDDMPIMIEAIPMSPEQIVLIITKVDSPEELDTRFSEFTHFGGDEVGVVDEGPITHPEIPEELIELLARIRDDLIEAQEKAAEAAGQEGAAEAVCVFAFDDMEEAIPAAQAVDGYYRGYSSLYREEDGEYLLFMHCGRHSLPEFNRITHTVGGYLRRRNMGRVTEAWCREHDRVIIADRAVSSLAQL